MSVLHKLSIKSLIALPVLLSSLSAMAADLTIDIKGVRGTAGTLQIAVFDQAVTYKKMAYEKAYAALTVKVNQQRNAITFHDVPKGQYAVSLFHDENSNNQMEKALTGMPKEGYGTSNASDRYDEPDFAKASVTVGDSNQTINIQMHYLGN